MKDLQVIEGKLEGFIKKYYINELVKGGIFFTSLGLLYLLFTVLIEHFLWLSTLGRTILFWAFILGELFLLIRFIIIPLARLSKLAKGIDYAEASEMIGSYFPEVKDKLINLLQLADETQSNELVKASIQQKSLQIAPVPFKIAINIKDNLKYIWLGIVPVILFVLLNVFYSSSWFTDSYDRVVNYNLAYEPPAPFQFSILNDSMTVREGENFTIDVRTTGRVTPEVMKIQYNGEDYFMENKNPGKFEYTFTNVTDKKSFFLSANDVISKPYELDVIAVPVLLDFEMHLKYPAYINKKNEKVKSTGNAIVPEGTKVVWNVNTKNTNEVVLITKDTLVRLDAKDRNLFTTNKIIDKNINYDIATSNREVRLYEKLSFQIKSIKDQFPEIKVIVENDSTRKAQRYFFGKVSDDYGLTKANLVYYTDTKPEDKKRIPIKIPKDNVGDFVISFPGNLDIAEGANYELFFEIYDNDILHNYKRTKSKVFNFRKFTKEEQEQNRLNQQKEAISGLNNSLSKFKKQQQELKEINKIQKEKSRLEYNDKRKLTSFLEQQKQQEKLMKQFSQQLKENLETKKEEKEKKEPFKDALKEMMERNEEKLKRNEKLREEIEKLADKMRKEELSEKLDELGKENKNIEKNLDQLLELTKRFYVIEKHEKLGDQLKEMAKKQEELSKEDERKNTKERQDSINRKFDEFTKEFEQLRKDNDKLRKPMNLDQKKQDETEIKREQNAASQKLQNKEIQDAKKNQKSAAQKMKQMQQGMQQQMQMNGESQQEEDMDMLRQILDNLVDYSLWQENLMKDFKEMYVNSPSYSTKLRRQSILKENFLHIDDSLYSLALRTPQISDKVTEKVTDITYNMDKALERLAENQIMVGASSQQYAVAGANDLAYMLSQALDQMQNSSPSSGKGKGGDSKGFQLPDIIKKQEELSDKLGKGKKSGEKGKGKESQKGEQQGEGNSKAGENGKGTNDKQGKSNEEGGKGKQQGSTSSDKTGQKGKGNGNGSGEGDSKKEGSGKGEEGEFGDEMNSQQIFEIYKQQQELRNKLKDKFQKAGFKDEKGSRILNKMEQVEQELLQNGLNESTQNKMLNIKHELMKLEESDLEQGEDNKRESNSNKDSFKTEEIDKIKVLQQYFNSIEILNRQALPLQPNYKKKVREYFKDKND